MLVNSGNERRWQTLSDLTQTLVFIAVADLNIEVGAPEKNRTFEFNLKCKIYLNVRYSEDWCYK